MNTTVPNAHLEVYEFPVGGQIQDVTVAPDGTAFFTDFAGGGIGRITVEGQVTIWKLPSTTAKPFGISYGPDGRCWFTEWSNGGENLISCVKADGSEYDSVDVGLYGTPRNIAAVGRDVFFTIGSRLGRVSIEDLRLTVFPFPGETAWRGLEATPLIGDAAGGVWVGFGGTGGYLERFDPVALEWEVVDVGPLQLNGIAVDDSGNVWFSSFSNERIGRLSPARELQVWAFPGRPFGITTTPAGELWVTEFSNRCLARVDGRTGSPVSRVELPESSAEPLNLVSDQVGCLWYAAQQGTVGRVGGQAINAAKPVVREIEPPIRRLRDAVPEFAGELGDLPPDRDPIRVKVATHPSFLQPGADVTVWRYLDLAKLAAMLDARALFFARLDTQSDPFEGSLPQRDGSDLEFDELTPGGLDGEQTREFLRLHREALSVFRPRALISCWHMNEYESMAMWDLYAQTGMGIGIRSSTRRLIDSLHGDVGGDPAPPPAYMGVVRYIDYNSTLVLPQPRSIS